MKFSFALVIAALVAAGSTANAADGQVSSKQLAALGLSGMKSMSDSQGMAVRGQSSNAKSSGSSLVFGVLIDPHTGSFVSGSSVNFSKATAENAGLNALSNAGHNQASGLDISLLVVTPTSSFSGRAIGGAGGSGFAFGF